MLKSSTNIPNRIKQPAQCCIYCGKSYLLKTNLDKHIIICELLHNSKKLSKKSEEDDDAFPVPSQKRQYFMLLELANRFSKMEEKVEELNKWVIRKKKKINIVEWLNTNMKPETIFDYLNEKIIVTEDDINYLFDNTFIATLQHIFSRTLYNVENKTHIEEDNIEQGVTSSNSNKNLFPIFAFVQKANLFYIYENEEAGWTELNREKLIKFLNKVYMKVLKAFIEWKKINNQQIIDNEKVSIMCDKTSIKMMSVDFKHEATLSKIRGNMYSRMKTDMKALVEYEFQF
jgi:hypothetical protein